MKRNTLVFQCNTTLKKNAKQDLISISISICRKFRCDFAWRNNVKLLYKCTSVYDSLTFFFQHEMKFFLHFFRIVSRCKVALTFNHDSLCFSIQFQILISTYYMYRTGTVRIKNNFSLSLLKMISSWKKILFFNLTTSPDINLNLASDPAILI